MKTLLAFLFSGYFLSVANAQKFDTIPPYQKDSTIPALSILQTDSTWFNKEALPRNEPVVIIYFRPDCGHCQLTAHEFEQKMDQLKDVFFIWVSYDSVSHIKSFAEEYKLLDAKNIKVGRDTKYYVPSFFKIKFTPYIAVYNKKGKLIQTYEGGTDPDTIIRLLHPPKS
jgi:thiol-disulfide isomerase/thioredoxin